MSKYQGCPECGNEHLTEWTHELCSHDHVRMRKDGQPSFENDKPIEMRETVNVLYYECEGCHTRLATTKEGRLVPFEDLQEEKHHMDPGPTDTPPNEAGTTPKGTQPAATTTPKGKGRHDTPRKKYTAAEWQLYCSMEGVGNVARQLNRIYNRLVAEGRRMLKSGTARKRTVVNGIRDDMYEAMKRYDKFGAADTEPMVVVCYRLEEDFGIEVNRW